MLLCARTCTATSGRSLSDGVRELESDIARAGVRFDAFLSERADPLGVGRWGRKKRTRGDEWSVCGFRLEERRCGSNTLGSHHPGVLTSEIPPAVLNLDIAVAGNALVELTAHNIT